jgi:hypothetical protein
MVEAAKIVRNKIKWKNFSFSPFFYTLFIILYLLNFSLCTTV